MSKTIKSLRGKQGGVEVIYPGTSTEMKINYAKTAQAKLAASNKVKVKKLIKDELHPDTVGTKKGGNILCRWGYYYSHGATAEDYAMKVRRLLTNNNIPYRIMNSGDHWVAFKGGASVANQSHFWVEVYIG